MRIQYNSASIQESSATAKKLTQELQGHFDELRTEAKKELGTEWAGSAADLFQELELEWDSAARAVGQAFAQVASAVQKADDEMQALDRGLGSGGGGSSSVYRSV